MSQLAGTINPSLLFYARHPPRSCPLSAMRVAGTPIHQPLFFFSLNKCLHLEFLTHPYVLTERHPAHHGKLTPRPSPFTQSPHHPHFFPPPASPRSQAAHPSRQVWYVSMLSLFYSKFILTLFHCRAGATMLYSADHPFSSALCHSATAAAFPPPPTSISLPLTYPPESCSGCSTGSCNTLFFV